jgi:polar amino acid transport system substrate-binding protein
LIAAAVAAVCGCRSSGGGDGDTLAQIKTRGEIVWGADEAGGAPYVSEENGHYVGFEVDLMDEIAHRLGVKAKFHQTDWPALVPSLERRDFDVIMNGLEATKDRQERILLSKPYYVFAETLAIQKGAPYHALDDLRGKRIGTLSQSYAFNILREKGFDSRPYDTVLPYEDLALGKLDAALLDDVVANRAGCPRKEIECLPDPVAIGTYVVGIRKEDASLGAAIDAALDGMRKDGTLERILTRWGLWNLRQNGPFPELPSTPDVAQSFDGDQLQLFASAALVTLGVSFAAFLLAMVVGLLLAMARVYGGAPTRIAARVYIELFRGTPVLLQLLVLYYGLAPYWRLGPVEAAVLGLGLNYGAYEAEVYRGALLALPRGQTEASKALGMSPRQTLRYVLLPQAFRLALPAMTNDFVSLLKDSSLVSSIAVIELTKRMQIASIDLRGYLAPGLACAAFYMILSFPLSELARRLERRLSRDQRPLAL